MRRIGVMILAIAALILPGFGLRAQLPTVQLPGVPVPAVPGVPDVTRAVGGTLRELAGARALRADRLLREHRAELDRDARGELVVRAEVVAIDLSPEALDKALAARFSVLRTRDLVDLGLRITVLQTPDGMSATRGLKRLRKLDPAGTYDYNHVYLDGGEVGSTQPVAPAISAPTDKAGNGVRRVGLIDGGVDAAHRVFQPVRVRHHGCDGRQIPNPHGTAVASILARAAVTEILAADVYCGEPAGGAISSVAEAFGWMARERVAVINVSLVGPRNALLERVIARLVSDGYVIVAAVGNDGPASPPLFPAAYEGVVGVTGVDARHRVLIEAVRGKQVDFAARGADLSAASGAPDQYVAVRGTSFAAPGVAALFGELQAPDVAQREKLRARIASNAHDLGKPGRDDIYGEGELPYSIGLSQIEE